MKFSSTNQAELTALIDEARREILSGKNPEMVAESITGKVAQISLPYDAFFSTWRAMRNPKSLLPYAAVAGGAYLLKKSHDERKKRERDELIRASREARELELDRMAARIHGRRAVSAAPRSDHGAYD